MYDPPDGWRYGFPKLVKDTTWETALKLLEASGYPKRNYDIAKKYGRYIHYPEGYSKQ